MGYVKPLLLLVVQAKIALTLVATAYAQNTSSSGSLTKLQEIAKTYEIEIVTSDSAFSVQTVYGAIDGDVANNEDMTRYVELFASEFTLYPADFVERSLLKRVIFCGELSYEGQRRNAIPDFEHNTLYFDVTRGAYNKTYQRKVIHHEYFHLVDYRDDGHVYEDVRWASLNPAEFRYGKGGQSVQDMQSTSVLTDQFPGFLNHYSTTGVEEDKAELFANLMVDHKHVEATAQQDRVLNAKVRRMKEVLKTFCPAINEAFWEQVRNAKRANE